jgi:hypothetical protein
MTPTISRATRTADARALAVTLPGLRSLVGRLAAAAIFAAPVAACLVNGASHGEVESRYATVHNALSALGLSEVGPLHDARIADGQEAHIELDLLGGCTTIVAIGGVTLADLDASLVDSAGSRIARGAMHTPEATIRACVETAGHYTLNVKAAHGQGSLLVSTWSGGAPAEPGGPGARGSEGGLARGTCDSPIPLSAGDYGGSTVHAESHNDPKAAGNPANSLTAPELVYRLELTARQRVTVSVETTNRSGASEEKNPYDSILYMRKGDCGSVEAEVLYNDDASPPGGGPHDNKHSRIEGVLDPATYYVFVDGYQGKSGSFTMHVDVADVPSLAELCSQAALLTPGTPIDGTTEGTFDQADAKCGDGAHGPDAVYTLAVEHRSRVRVVEHSDDFKPVVHLRSQCDDPDSKRGCAAGDDDEAAFVGILDPGAYAVFADSVQPDATGKYTLTAEVAPELGAGVTGERCADAIPLVKSEPSFKGDTFNARDDLAGSCGGTGAPDVVYRLDVSVRTRLSAHVTHEQGSHVLVLLKGCTGPRVELGCGKSIDSVLPPGSYFLAVDGDSPEGFGTFEVEWSAKDTLAQDAACRTPALLREGDTVTGNTAAGGATDKFTPSCAGTDANGGAADLVYKIVVPTRRRVHLLMRPTGWSGVLSVRRTCIEGATPGAGEVECHVEDSADVSFDAVLDPGTYFVVVDGKDSSSVGTFTLEYRSGASPGARPPPSPPASSPRH